MISALILTEERYNGMNKISEMWGSLVDFLKDYVVFPLSNIGIIDVIDILLLATLIFI